MSVLNSNFGLARIRERLSDRGRRIFFAGIMGAGTSPLAELLARRGYTVLGCDKRASQGAHLWSLGIELVPEDRTESLHGVGLFVYSLAIDEDYPMLLAARAAGIPTVSRAELLGALMLDYTHRIGISGTHGKSTTTAMVGSVLRAAGRSPTVICGAELDWGSCLSFGGDEYLVYEACEYKDSFLKFSPTYAVVTNIELDHTDYFPNIEALWRSFALSLGGCSLAVLNADDVGALSVSAREGRAVTYGFSSGATYRCTGYECGGEGSRFTVEREGVRLGEFRISVIGMANLSDALAAVAVCHSLGVGAEDIRRGLCDFRGVYRRLTRLGAVSGRALYYDYAHHPTEIFNTVRTLRGIFGKCTAVFRPHTYSRTQALLGGFASALGEADFAVVTDIYGAREERSDITAEELARAVGRGCVYLPAREILGYVLDKTEGAIVLMGAGELDAVKNDFEKMLTKEP